MATVGRITVRSSPPAADPAARFSNRVYCLRNASRTVPVGPLRCLPMMISAMPSASGCALAVGRVHLLAEDEEHDVGVLLERAGLAQVRELRPMIAARSPARG